ncbi:hypothetical protein GN956_G16589 [Arapaima gigas]
MLPGSACFHLLPNLNLNSSVFLQPQRLRFKVPDATALGSRKFVEQMLQARPLLAHNETIWTDCFSG